MEPNASLRVLIVDDNEAVRLLLTAMLTDLGHQVVGEAEDHNAALEAYDQHKPDLVTLDLSLNVTLGRGDGLSVLKALRERNAAVKVIIISGNSQKKVLELVASSGAAAFVPKPIKEDALAAAIASAITK